MSAPKGRRRPRQPRRPRVPTRDPVTQYAVDVRKRVIVAGRAVRLACARQETDLARARTEGFPYYWDAAAAQHLIDFFPRFLTLEDGSPFTLPPWLQFSYGAIFGWKCWDGKRPGKKTVVLSAEHVKRRGKRRFVHGFFETSKGSGKTPSAGGLGLYGLAYDDEGHAQIYTTGFDKDQAGLILTDAIRMATDTPEDDFRAEFDIGKHNIAHLKSGSFFRAMSSQHRSKSGPRPHFILSDEIHEHRDGTVVSKAEAGFKFRTQPLGLKYTNSGSEMSSYCGQLHEKSLKVLEGGLIDEQWFAYICQLDPCDACFAEGYRQPKDGCTRCDDWTDRRVWPKIAPALGIVIQEKYLQDAVDTALSMPSEYALKRRLNFCLWSTTHTVWIGSDAWQACRRETESECNDGRACAVGFDMAEKIDLTAGVVALRVDDDEDAAEDCIELVDVVDGQEVRKTLNLNFSVELIPFFWIPEATAHARVTNERVPYDVWRHPRPGPNGPWVRVTPGPVIDADLIYEQFTKDIGKRYRPQRVGYDAHNATQFALQLRDKGKYTVVDVPQGKALSESFKLFEALVLLKRIRHHGNPLLAYCVGNAEPKRDRYQNLWIEKPSQKKPIDGLVAAVIALSQLVLLPAKPRKSRGAKVWTPGGFVSALPPKDPGQGALHA